MPICAHVQVERSWCVILKTMISLGRIFAADSFYPMVFRGYWGPKCYILEARAISAVYEAVGTTSLTSVFEPVNNNTMIYFFCLLLPCIADHQFLTTTTGKGKRLLMNA